MGVPLKGSIRATIRVLQGPYIITYSRVPLKGGIRAAIRAL